jgi:N-ethylmaleimide reductase
MTMTEANSLFTPVTLGALALKHRVAMAPLTRLRATRPGDVPRALNAQYYGQRAQRDGGEQGIGFGHGHGPAEIGWA